MATQYISKVKTSWYSIINKNYENAPVQPFKRSLFSSTVYIHGAIYVLSTIFASVNEILRCGHSNETSIVVFFFHTMSFLNSRCFTH